MNKRTYTSQRCKASKAGVTKTTPSWFFDRLHATLTRALLLYYAIRGDKCTLIHRLALVTTMAYTLFPYDLLADTSPMPGLLDDALLLTAAAISLLGCIDARIKIIAGLKAHQLLLKAHSLV
ncbi:DUF1232 domain-containing protein [Pseudoalteromonas sp. BDTF-M6]|uniref:DUF1232 domain-containing protein n=1 Tax=Pseudoalteromonas sp. BDTF-M6 TaxID=2796132 RepID=UPI0024B6020D|nr:DUF1232 domain-containing protein [Pseudoalteromonas sp. BDTF-M6]